MIDPKRICLSVHGAYAPEYQSRPHVLSISGTDAMLSQAYLTRADVEALRDWCTTELARPDPRVEEKARELHDCFHASGCTAWDDGSEVRRSNWRAVARRVLGLP